MLDELYSEFILDLYKEGKLSKELKPHQIKIEAHNPLCGDSLILGLSLTKDKIEISIVSIGCAISVASGALLCKMYNGKTIKKTNNAISYFTNMLTKEEQRNNISQKESEKLNIFKGVKKFPVRVKCATMPWRALEQAINEAIS